MTDDTVAPGKQLADFATELLDSEVQAATAIIVRAQLKYQHRANTAANLDQLRDEVLTNLAQIGILASFDPAPAFYGEPPVVEFIGKITGDPIHTVGFDHEQKGYEVKKALKRDEDYLGQKERPNKRVPKKK